MRSPAAPRRLHRGHFAFMRALIQGMDERAAWERYLRAESDGGDRRHVRGTIQWIRDAFAAAARREHRPGTARLILFDAERIQAEEAASVQRPSLEAFALAQGLEDFSEAEQIEAYEAAYPGAAGGGPRRAAAAAEVRLQRRRRVIQRQLDALRWLEALVARDPRPVDRVDAWLNPALAARLRRAGLHTLEQLVAHMNRTGARWWTQVPGVGQHKAQRVVAWIQAHGDPLQLTLGPHVLQPRSTLAPHLRAAVVSGATAIRPLEKFVVPPELDGRVGPNRRPQAECLSPVSNDLEAIQAWLASRISSASRVGAATHRSYRKEAERLLLWAVLEQRKPLSAVTHEDVGAYIGFLRSPPALWCAPRYHQRWTPQWRPLEGPLSVSAIGQACLVLHGLFAYLVRQGYLVENPFAGWRARIGASTGEEMSEGLAPLPAG